MGSSTSAPVKAADLRTGAGSSNFCTARCTRAQDGPARDLAHKLDCEFSSIVTTASGTPEGDLVGVRRCLADDSNLRMKSQRGNRSTDRKGERIIAAVL